VGRVEIHNRDPIMCEIFLVWALGKQLAEYARRKGHTPAGYVVILVVLWIAGEIGGFIVGAIISTLGSSGGGTYGGGYGGGGYGGSSEPNIVIFYGCAILGAALGAAISFGIVALLPDYGGANQVAGFPRRGLDRYDDRYDRNYGVANDFDRPRPAPERDDQFMNRDNRVDKGDKWTKDEKWE
jgi:hypothetical protein